MACGESPEQILGVGGVSSRNLRWMASGRTFIVDPCARSVGVAEQDGYLDSARNIREMPKTVGDVPRFAPRRSLHRGLNYRDASRDVAPARSATNHHPPPPPHSAHATVLACLPLLTIIRTSIMAGLKNSPFGKRLRRADEDSPRKNRTRFHPVFPTASASTPSLDSRPGTSEGATPESPDRNAHRDYGDRFVPSRDAGDMRTTFHLMDGAMPSTPSKNRIIPTESDALKEQANSIFNTILHTEVTPASPQRPGSPVRPPTTSTTNLPTTPTRRRLFAFNSPSRSNPATPSRRLDMPTDEAYSLSPVRAESRQLLESPRRQLRSVCKTPYRVLDAPELADDFYLNLVDWSSTNVLGVGLGSCVYLWTAHTAQVSKLCDLNNLHDTISSVSWVQKVCVTLHVPH